MLNYDKKYKLFHEVLTNLSSGAILRSQDETAKELTHLKTNKFNVI